jgi:hypothetical protein
MTQAMRLNPLTAGRIEGAGEAAVLRSRSFAPGRSLIETVIARTDQPALFDVLADWLDLGADPPLPELDRTWQLQLWSNGLLLSAAEYDALAAGKRPQHDELDLAAMLCPAVAGLRREGPQLVSPDPAWAEIFARQQTCNLPCLFAAETWAAIQTWYSLLRDGNWLKPDRHQTVQKIVRDDPVARCVQAALVPMVSAIVGRRVTPGLSYASLYHDGADLPRHTDRSDCEYALSLFVDYQPDPGSELCPWPLIVHHTDRDRTYHQARGGGLLFSGHALEHSRPPLPEGASAMIFMMAFAGEAS